MFEKVWYNKDILTLESQLKVHNIPGNIISVSNCTALDNMILSMLWSLHKEDEEFVRILQSEVCEIVGCNPGSMIRSIVRLEKLGLIERAPYKSKNEIKGYKVVLPAQNDN